MKQLLPGSVLTAALLILLVDFFWLHPRTVQAQGSLKVYVQQVKDKRWTDIQGTEIVGFACGPEARANSTVCYVASR